MQFVAVQGTCLKKRCNGCSYSQNSRFLNNNTSQINIHGEHAVEDPQTSMLHNVGATCRTVLGQDRETHLPLEVSLAGKHDLGQCWLCVCPSLPPLGSAWRQPNLNQERDCGAPLAFSHYRAQAHHNQGPDVIWFKCVYICHKPPSLFKELHMSFLCCLRNQALHHAITRIYLPQPPICFWTTDSQPVKNGPFLGRCFGLARGGVE
mmetsp:Transcript_65500/g.109929  ORF Transcript_65500/g.109929 Transcript_65500/m.109929 type:complete len:206 (-) Transcript_65500:270-887(-)